MTPYEFWQATDAGGEASFRSRNSKHHSFYAKQVRTGGMTIFLLVMQRIRGDWMHIHRRMTIRWPGVKISVCFFGSRSDVDWPASAQEHLIEMHLRLE